MTDELDPTRLHRLLELTARLSRSADVERDAWPAIRERIDAQQVRPLASGPQRTAATSRPVPWRAVAAAVLLVSVSSAVTAWLLRSSESAPIVSNARETSGGLAGVTRNPSQVPTSPESRASERAAVSPASDSRVDLVYSRYDAAASDLAAALTARRSRLDPRTMAVLDSCLRRIDAAITEARAALRNDPRNPVISELLAASYSQKLDLLKRATDLPLASFQD